MLVKLVRGDCNDGKTCPALLRTDRGTVLIQGRTVTDGQVLRQMDWPSAAAVEVPSGLLAEVADSWPSEYRTDRGTLVVSGILVKEADVLDQLRLGADEQAVKIPAAIVARVLAAC